METHKQPKEKELWEYNWAAKAERLHGQFKKLAYKINYMTGMTNWGRKIGRNTPCPCKSGRKYKKCCVVHHDANVKKVGQLQVAMSKLQARAKRYGMEGVAR